MRHRLLLLVAAASFAAAASCATPEDQAPIAHVVVDAKAESDAGAKDGTDGAASENPESAPDQAGEDVGPDAVAEDASAEPETPADVAKEPKPEKPGPDTGGICAVDGGDAGDPDGPDANACVPLTFETGKCNCTGTRQRFCDPDGGGTWGPWSTCVGGTMGGCNPCETQVEPCGLCGKRINFCEPTLCQWVTGACVGIGECNPGDFKTDAVGCPTGKVKVKKCDAACAWGSWSPCVDPPGWEVVPASPLGGRKYASATFTGAEIVVWGGQNQAAQYQNTGSRYDLATKTWKSMANPPATIDGRWRHTAVWTGTEVIIWGGTGSNGPSQMGARYDPVGDKWTPMSTQDVPEGRYMHASVWTGAVLFVWGGQGKSSSYLASGALYDPLTDKWTATTASPLPGRYATSAVWDPGGKRVIVFAGYTSGGSTGTSDGAKFDPAGNAWTAIAAASIKRYGHAAVWNDVDATMLVWGGTENFSQVVTGGRYDPAGDKWTAIASGTTAGMQPKSNWTAVWGDGKLWVGGGESPPGKLAFAWDAATDSWAKLPDMNQGRSQHAAAWAGRFFVWGGIDATFQAQNHGEVLRPLP